MQAESGSDPVAMVEVPLSAPELVFLVKVEAFVVP